MSQRTVPPTALDVQRSFDTLEAPLSSLLLFAASLLVLRVVGPLGFSALLSFARGCLASLRSSPNDLAALPWSALAPLAWAALSLVLVGVGLVVLQTRGAVHRGRDVRRVPPEGLGPAGAVLLLVTAALVILDLLSGDPSEGTLVRSRVASVDLLLGVILSAGVLDYARRWVRWRAMLHLTPDEARRRHREDHGDPAVRTRRRELHHERLVEPMLSDDWLLLADARELVAISFSPDPSTPTLVLRAREDFMRSLQTTAMARGLSCVLRPDLVRALAATRVGDPPPGGIIDVLKSLRVHRLTL